jgi:hypothetical protein
MRPATQTPTTVATNIAMKTMTITTTTTPPPSFVDKESDVFELC